MAGRTQVPASWAPALRVPGAPPVRSLMPATWLFRDGMQGRPTQACPSTLARRPDTADRPEKPVPEGSAEMPRSRRCAPRLRAIDPDLCRAPGDHRHFGSNAGHHGPDRRRLTAGPRQAAGTTRCARTIPADIPWHGSSLRRPPNRRTPASARPRVPAAGGDDKKARLRLLRAIIGSSDDTAVQHPSVSERQLPTQSGCSKPSKADVHVRTYQAAGLFRSFG